MWNPQEIDSDIIVNIQGDEPLLDPDDIQKVDEKLKYPDSVINCMSRFDSTEIRTEIFQRLFLTSTMIWFICQGANMEQKKDIKVSS